MLQVFYSLTTLIVDCVYRFRLMIVMMIGGRRGEGKNKHGHRSSLVWLCNGLSGSVSFFYLDGGYIFLCLIYDCTLHTVLCDICQSNSFSDTLEIQFWMQQVFWYFLSKHNGMKRLGFYKNVSCTFLMTRKILRSMCYLPFQLRLE